MIVTNFAKRGNALRTVRSFVLRKGRLSPGQAKALNLLWEKWSLPASACPYTNETLNRLFGRAAPLNLEIGCGNGEALLALARERPDENFLGVDVHRPGLGACLNRLESTQRINVRLIEGDVVPLLSDELAELLFANIFIWFPDPWPKTKHHKRRLITAPFLSLLAGRLVEKGRLWIATDWDPYALQIVEAARLVPSLKNVAVPGPYLADSIRVGRTRFERKGIDRGHPIRDLCYAVHIDKEWLT